MAGVVADFVDVGGHNFRQTVVLLEIHGQIPGALTANLRECLGISDTVGGDPDHIRTRRGQRLDLGDRGVDILSTGGRHALYGYGVMVSDHDGTDTDGASWVSRDSD
jgi:hypothetical protein